MTSVPSITTAEQLWRAGDIGRCELVRGELTMMSPAGFDHGEMGVAIAAALRAFVRPRRLGKVVGADTGFWIERHPDTIRAPDVAFVRQERLRGRQPGYFDGPPDLAVEIVSPHDRRSDVDANVEQWLAAGAVVVWVVDPARRQVVCHQRQTPAVTFGAEDTLSCDVLLPGFTLPLAEICDDHP
jgi:Uma2 family endonuclease